jgi:hypothetical protein
MPWPTRRRTDQRDKPEPIVSAGVTIPPEQLQHPGRRPNLGPTGYLRVPVGDGHDSRIPAPRYAALPPAEQIARHDPDLAQLVGEHPALTAAYHRARQAVDDPAGYKAAVDADRRAVQAGQPPDPHQSAAAGWLYHRPARIGAAVLASLQVDEHLDRIIAAANASPLEEATSAAVDQWTDSAVERVNTAVADGDKPVLLIVEHELGTVYRPRRALWNWARRPDRPYQPAATGLPIPLRDAIWNNTDRIQAILGGQVRGGMYGSLTLNLAGPGGRS